MSLRKFGLAVVITTIAVLSAASIDAPASAHSRSGHHRHHHRHHRVDRRYQPIHQICRGIPPYTQCVPVKR